MLILLIKTVFKTTTSGKLSVSQLAAVIVSFTVPGQEIIPFLSFLADYRKNWLTGTGDL